MRSAPVVEDLDVLEDLAAGMGARFERVVADELFFERSEEVQTMAAARAEDHQNARSSTSRAFAFLGGARSLRRPFAGGPDLGWASVNRARAHSAAFTG
jgi:hypothetical protein